jgi:hypothetical protein
VLTQVARNAAAGGAPHAGAHDLHRSHQGISEEHGPGQGVAELSTGLRIGCDPARVIIGCPRDKAGTQDLEQPRLGGLDDRTGTGIDGLLDFEGHVSLG